MRKERLGTNYDPSKYTTQLNLYKFYGYAPGEKVTDCLRTCIPMSIFVYGLVHFSLYVKNRETNGATRTDIIEAIHWSVVYCMLIVCIFFMVKYSHVYTEIDRIIRSGVYDYGEDLTEEQQSICERANKLVLKLGKLFVIAFIATISTSLTKHTVFRRKPDSWNTVFKGWTPFVINSWPRYLVIYVVHIIMIINTSTSGYLVVVSFLTFGIHLGAQLKSLRIALQDIFLSEKNQTEEQILAKLKKCAAHHAEIKRFFNLVQVYSGSASGILSVGSVGMICTYLYDITSQHTVEASFVVILPEASLIITYSLIGQYITNESENLRTFLYEVDWYAQPSSVQKFLLVMMMASKKSLDSKGFGVFKYNLEGLTEVMQATYTFYNALNATK